VLTHIARNADSVVRRLQGAVRGEVLDQYVGGLNGRASEIEAGADRPAVELVADVRESAQAVERIWATLPITAWDALSRSSRDVEEDGRVVVFSRWREVAIHHRDLGLTEEPVPLPAALVELCLPRELERLAGRTDPAELLAWTFGRGPAPKLAPW
jgi:maleylpyruvate isomerase